MPLLRRRLLLLVGAIDRISITRKGTMVYKPLKKKSIATAYFMSIMCWVEESTEIATSQEYSVFALQVQQILVVEHVLKHMRWQAILICTQRDTTKKA